MRKTLFASTFALLGLAAAVPTEAMPFPPLGEKAPSAITLTAGGCGIAFIADRGAAVDQMATMGIVHMPMAIAPTPTATGIARTAFTVAGAGGAAECASALER
jgi:hypothetical protein